MNEKTLRNHYWSLDKRTKRHNDRAIMDSVEFQLFVFLGLPTWALVDGTWAALSQLAETLPEGYSISAYLILALTFGNIVPLVVGIILNKSIPETVKILIRAILITGLCTGLLMGFLWNITIPTGSSRTSWPLFILFFIVGACASSSNVTHYTFVSLTHAPNTTGLATGMGLGSMTAGILALIQGLLLANSGFSVTIYYIVLSLLYVPALFALYKLWDFTSANSGRRSSTNIEATQFPDIEQEYVNNDENSQVICWNEKTETQTENPLSTQILTKMLVGTAAGTSSTDGEAINDRSAHETEYNEWEFVGKHVYILSLMFVNASLGYGVVPAVISTACSRFAHRNAVLLLATGITAVIDPLAKWLTYYVRFESFRGLLLGSTALVFLATGLVLCAALPGDLSLYQGSGGALPVCLYISFGALFGFTNTSIFRYFKEHVSHAQVQHAYRWGGVSGQAGALVGSLIAFAIVISGVL
jgi:hypothetical protein